MGPADLRRHAAKGSLTATLTVTGRLPPVACRPRHVLAVLVPGATPVLKFPPALGTLTGRLFTLNKPTRMKKLGVLRSPHKHPYKNNHQHTNTPRGTFLGRTQISHLPRGLL